MSNSTPPSSLHLETLLVHGNRQRSSLAETGTPTVMPIHASTTYLYESVEALDQAFSGKAPNGEPAFVYARQANPSAHVFEEAISKVEGGKGAVSFSSGMAAIHAALLTAGLTTGAKILLSRDVYGQTVTLLRKVFVPIGIELVLADLCCPAATELIAKEQPDIIYVETVSNPLVKVMDVDAVVAAAREVGAVTIVDSTFTTPYLLRPIEHGFDLVVHSATKYIGGHGDSTGGVVVSSSNALLDQLRSNAILLGAMLSPFDAHLLTRGLRTLALRMERQCQNALQIAQFLQEHPAVERVYYPGLPEHPQHTLAARLLDHDLFGGLLAFELKAQSRESAFRFMNALRLCLPGTSLGDVFSLVSYPPISTHRTLTTAECETMGIRPGCIRLSAGIENIQDILNDLQQALDVAE